MTTSHNVIRPSLSTLSKPVSRQAQTRRSALGFTLLETVMVLMLLAVLTLLIASVFNVTRRADVRTSHWTQSLAHLDAAQSYLRRALMSARPAALATALPSTFATGSSITHSDVDANANNNNANDNNNDNADADSNADSNANGGMHNGKTVFVGDDARMGFFAPAPMVQESSGPKFNDLRIKQIDAQRWLVLQLFSLAPNGTLQPWGEEQILAGPLRDAKFAYQGRDAQGKSTGWLSRWPWPNRLPRIVRIQVDETRGLPWQTMTIPLLLQSVDQQGGGA